MEFCVDFRKVQFKRVKTEFLCALCGTKRELRYNKNLTLLNYFQILLTSSALIYLLFPYFSYKALYILFIVWLVFEISIKLLYRRDIPCKNCGFDATWYKRDVKLARKKVEEFWSQNKTSKNQQDSLLKK